MLVRQAGIAAFSAAVWKVRTCMAVMSLLAASGVGCGASFAQDVGTPVGRTLTIRDGEIRGVTAKGVDEFLGIPYAAPPIGELRWKPPQAPEQWQGVRDATRFGNRCPQITTLGAFAGPTSIDEDCLYLNVFRTSGSRRGAKRPVIVWFHGGGYIDGASNDYDASKLASGGPSGTATIVVTLNYRLGMFGIFSHPALNQGPVWGNYSVLDQQAALHWVQQNIDVFGGDPAKVTIAGQSAGSAAVGVSLISPLAKGLFHRGISQSSPGFNAWLPTAETTAAIGQNFASAAGCPGADDRAAACLRRLSAARILQLQGTLRASGPYHTNYPFVDGTIIPMQPEQAWRSGNFNKVPMILGGTQDEGTFFLAAGEYFSWPFQPPITPANYDAMITPGAYCIFCNPARVMPPGVGTQFKLVDFGGDAMLAYQRIGSDAARCRDIHVAERLAPQVPVYAYDFTYEDAPFYFPKMPGLRPAASHTIDIQFLFRGYHGGDLGVNLDQVTGMPRELNAAETKLSDTLVAAWTNFADVGNPNGTGDLPWPRFKADGSGRYFVQNLNLSTISASDFRAKYRCDFFDPQLTYDTGGLGPR